MYVSPQLSDCRKTSFVDKKGVAGAEPPYRSSAICATASCSGFVWLTASILAWSRGGSPSKIPLSPRERGQGDRGSELEVCFKNILFLQTEPCIALMHGFYVIGCSFQRSAYPLRSFRHAVLQAIHSYCSRLLQPCREFLRFRC